MTTAFEVSAADFEHAAQALTVNGFITVSEPIIEGTIYGIGILVRRKVRNRLARHNRTGKLRSLVVQDSKGRGYDYVMVVKSAGPVAHLVAGGVKPHEIRSLKPMPIRAAAGGVTTFAQAVHHPGFRGDPYFRNGIRDAGPDIDALVAQSAADLEREVAARVTR